MQLTPDFSNDYSYLIHNRELLIPLIVATFWRLDVPFDDFTASLKYTTESLMNLLLAYLLAYYWQEINIFDYMKPFGLTQHGVLSSTVFLYTLRCTLSNKRIKNRHDIIIYSLIIVYMLIHFNIFKTITDIIFSSSNVTQVKKNEYAISAALTSWVFLCFIVAKIKQFRYRGIYVFLSYRRQDSILQTKSIYYYLVRRLGAKRVFMDQTSIPLGENFESRISKDLSRASVLLVVIGPAWISASKRYGEQRLHETNDPVRMEINLALNKNIPIIPVLVNCAVLPSSEDLPEDLRLLPKFNGQIVRLGEAIDFEEDMDKIIARFLSLKPT